MFRNLFCFLAFFQEKSNSCPQDETTQPTNIKHITQKPYLSVPLLVCF